MGFKGKKGQGFRQKDVDINKVGSPEDSNIVWDDIRFPFAGRNLDVSSGRIDYNYYNGGIDFQNNARYNVAECVSMLCQLQHDWKQGSNLRPHIHWLQISADEPNWLLGYKILNNGDTISKETDFSGHTLVQKDGNAFTYVSGNLIQITKFPEIDMSGVSGVSQMIHFVFFRDTDNDSGIFTTSDPSSNVEFAFEFDTHYQRDMIGSREEYIK